MITIKVPRPANLQALFDHAKRDAQEHNISCSGDLSKGEGSGFGFAGSYTVDDTHITVRVTKKPFIVTAGKIEKAVKEYIQKNG
jgi:hypothetical protein